MIVLLLVCLSGLTTAVEAADVRFSRVFSDNTVLQRDVPVMIRGFADPGETVTVTFATQSKEAVADQAGVWTVTLDPMAASAEGRTLACSAGGGKSTASLKNVVVGD
ncbi:MAG: hypothetical protein R3336_08235, partial [Phycisphaeraceae bacterium]|nr:hypothetical protein [Phycisphaeraceae bacterium]